MISPVDTCIIPNSAAESQGRGRRGGNGERRSRAHGVARSHTPSSEMLVKDDLISSSAGGSPTRYSTASEESMSSKYESCALNSFSENNIFPGVRAKDIAFVGAGFPHPDGAFIIENKQFVVIGCIGCGHRHIRILHFILSTFQMVDYGIVVVILLENKGKRIGVYPLDTCG